MKTGRPRKLYREFVVFAEAQHAVGISWEQIGCRLKLDPQTLAAAVRRGAARYPCFYAPDVSEPVPNPTNALAGPAKHSARGPGGVV